MSEPAGFTLTPALRRVLEEGIERAREEGISPLEFARRVFAADLESGDPELEAAALWALSALGPPLPNQMTYLTMLEVDEIPPTSYQAFLLSEWSELGVRWDLWRPWDDDWRKERAWEPPGTIKDNHRCWWFRFRSWWQVPPWKQTRRAG